MAIIIISKNVPPIKCGIGDHSIKLKDYLSLQKVYAEIASFNGKQTHNVEIYNNWEDILVKLSLIKSNKKNIILQFTPLAFADNFIHYNKKIVQFWRKCSVIGKKTLIIHETYSADQSNVFRKIRNRFEKELFYDLVSLSDHIFTASDLLIRELYKNGIKNVHYLPLGSNIDCVPIDKKIFRKQNNISENEIIILLFGSPNAVKPLVSLLDYIFEGLSMHGIKTKWVLLGGIRSAWFKNKLSFIEMNYLPENFISYWFQIADIFLVPHIEGLSAKRSSVMTAMQHGLPIIGTKGIMNDTFWNKIEGIKLIEKDEVKIILEYFIKLINDKDYREFLGKNNKDYYISNFSWNIIANKLLSVIQ